MNNKLYIGEDESYDVTKNGLLIMAFVVIDTEKDRLFFKNEFTKLQQKLNIFEFKNNKLHKNIKKQIFLLLEKMTLDTYIYQSPTIRDQKEIKKNYQDGLKSFIKFIANKKGLHYIDMELDEIGGSKFENENITLIYSYLKNKNIKKNIKFVASRKSLLVQIADLIAGETRKNLHGNSMFAKYLLKNKNLV